MSLYRRSRPTALWANWFTLAMPAPIARSRGRVNAFSVVCHDTFYMQANPAYQLVAEARKITLILYFSLLINVASLTYMILNFVYLFASLRVYAIHVYCPFKLYQFDFVL